MVLTAGAVLIAASKLLASITVRNLRKPACGAGSLSACLGPLRHGSTDALRPLIKGGPDTNPPRIRRLAGSASWEACLLDGLRVLVIEDEPTLALLVGEIIEDAEGELVGSCGSVREARELLRNDVEFDCALLDINLTDGDIGPVLEALRARGLPVVVQTGGPGLPDRIRKRHPDLKVLQKPVRAGHLVAALRRARLAAAGTQSIPA